MKGAIASGAEASGQTAGAPDGDDPENAAVTRLSAVALLAAGAVREMSAPLGYALAHIAHIEREIEAQRSNRHAASLDQLAGPLREVRIGVQQARNIAHEVFAAPERERESATKDLRRVILSCVKMARLELDQGAQVVLDLDALPPVSGSETRLSQIFYNLLSNAFWAACQMDGDPIIQVKSRRDGAFVSVDVTDSGPGIADGNIERVFEPFFTTRAADPLAGLGLTVCRRLAQEIGGRIEAASVSGDGATFRVLLPVAEEPLPSTRRAVPAESGFEPAEPPVRRLPTNGSWAGGTS